jgi:hypothetical protein
MIHPHTLGRVNIVVRVVKLYAIMVIKVKFRNYPKFEPKKVSCCHQSNES